MNGMMCDSNGFALLYHSGNLLKRIEYFRKLRCEPILAQVFFHVYGDRLAAHKRSEAGAKPEPLVAVAFRNATLTIPPIAFSAEMLVSPAQQRVESLGSAPHRTTT